jgi:hypothetical protein
MPQGCVSVSKAKWVMKQYWRIGAIRAVASLGLSMFVLGKFYYQYVPGLTDWGLIGAVIMSLFLIIVFMWIGWLYDEKLKLWNENVQANVERDPYQYVPNPRKRIFDYPFILALTQTFWSLIEEIGMDTTAFEELASYMRNYFKTSPTQKIDIDASLGNAHKFMEKHPFKIGLVSMEKVSIGSRVKKTFQVQVIRLTWIQTLTGLLQDTLVFGAFYVTVLFPAVATGTVVPLGYLIFGIVFISFPMLSVLLILGWYYDRRLMLWTPDLTVQVERNIFTYVPTPSILTCTIPFAYCLLSVFSEVFDKIGADKASIIRLAKFLEEYRQLDSSRDEDMIAARGLSSSFGPVFENSKKEIGEI